MKASCVAVVALAGALGLAPRAACAAELWLPLSPGARWRYTVSGHPAAGPLGAAPGTLELAVAGRESLAVRSPAGEQTSVDAWRLLGDVRDADWIAADARSIRVYRTRGDEGGRLPAPVLAAEWRVDGAAAWTSGEPAGRIGHLRGERPPDETITVPAGTFACARSSVEGDGFRSTLWLARGVGIVRHDVAWRSATGAINAQRWELIEWSRAR